MSEPRPAHTPRPQRLCSRLSARLVGSGRSSIVAEPLEVPVVGVALPCTTFEKEPDGVPDGCKVSTIPSPLASGSHASPSESVAVRLVGVRDRRQLSTASGTPASSASGTITSDSSGPMRAWTEGSCDPRWSVAGQFAERAVSIAALPSPDAIVGVGPPLSASTPSRGSPLVPGQPESGKSRLLPPSMVGTTQPLPAKTEFSTVIARPPALFSAGTFRRRRVPGERAVCDSDRANVQVVDSSAHDCGVADERAVDDRCRTPVVGDRATGQP